MSLCDIGPAPNNCHDLYAYVLQVLTYLAQLPVIKYAEYFESPSSDDLDALWHLCTPADCSLAVWYNTAEDEFEVWSYIGAGWHLVKTV